MQLMLDLHIHSKYSMATSPNMDLRNIYKWAQLKGIDVIATGDFTHPLWLREIKKEMVYESGLLYYKGRGDISFMLSVEVSNVFKRENKTYKIHSVILSNSVETVGEINEYLSNYGDLTKDGRPTLRIDIKDMVNELKRVDKSIEIFPAHIWTPWFSILGSKFGFSSVDEALRGIESKILAIETGLSSDPLMNWAISRFDNLPIISNSDAHSGRTIGRESTKVEVKERSYSAIINGIRKHIVKTYEYFPQEGKYYYDGHRKCGVCVSPRVYNKMKGICPVCKKRMTKGVLHRVIEMSDRKMGQRPSGRPGFSYILPLEKLIGYVVKRGEKSREVIEKANELRRAFGGEVNVYEMRNYRAIANIAGQKIADAIRKVNDGRIKWNPGCDGMYGTFSIK